MSCNIYSINTNGLRSQIKQQYVKKIIVDNNVDILCIKVVIHVEIPKAAPKKSICHFQKLEMILK